MAPPSTWIPRLEPLLTHPGERIPVFHSSLRGSNVARHKLAHGAYLRPPGRWRFESEVDRSVCPACVARDAIAIRERGAPYLALSKDVRRRLRDLLDDSVVHDHSRGVLFATFLGPVKSRATA